MSHRETFLHPRIIANLAASVDGKIDSIAREGAGFGSRLDRDRLDALRAEADALVVGAGTIRAEDPPFVIRDPARRHLRQAEGRPENPVVAVISKGGRLSPRARLFSEPLPRRLLVLPAGLDPEVLAPWRQMAARGELEILEAGTGTADLRALVARLARWGCRKIVVEGGGEVVASFLEAGLLDEVRLTLCPVILGGREAPTLVGGEGWRLAQRWRLALVEVDRQGDELFLRYEVQARTGGPAPP